MADDHKQRLEAILETALKLSKGLRHIYLNQVCQGDAEMRCHLEELLSALEPSPTSIPTSDSGLDLTSFEAVGTQIGPYKLVSEIGEGGMGTVFKAEQLLPVRRIVAIKIIKLGMDTKYVVARFEAERQALALMDHPNIARVLDAGVTKNGRPYFAMEYVNGISITDFCRENKLCIPDRIQLFLSVCRAIQSAHQKGVIHRDIKPSNVLVSWHGDEPVAKVIDFGIAKAVGHKMTDKTLVTQLGGMMGTLGYMSPEQADVKNADIDTRTDVYSLGALLYELLTGTTPIPLKRLNAMSYLEAQREILDGMVERPSTRLTSLSLEERATVLNAMSMDAKQLKHAKRRFRSDFDWILVKCLEKDRQRRYAGVGELIADLEKCLKGDAISARPPSLGYRLQTLWRRRKLVISAVSTVSVSVLVSLGLTIFFLNQSRQHLRETKAANEQIEGRSAFLYNAIFWNLVRMTNMPQTAKEMLMEKLYDDVSRQAQDDPNLQVDIYSEIGQFYMKAGQFKKAYGFLSKSYNILESKNDLIGIDHRLSCLNKFSKMEQTWAEDCNSRDDRLLHEANAVKYAKQAVVIAQNASSSDQLGNHKERLAVIYRHQHDFGNALRYELEAVNLFLSCREFDDALLGEESIARNLSESGNYPAGEKYYSNIGGTNLKYPSSAGAVAWCKIDWGITLIRQGRIEDARQTLTDVANYLQLQHDDDSGKKQTICQSMALIDLVAGNFDQASTQLRDGKRLAGGEIEIGTNALANAHCAYCLRQIYLDNIELKSNEIPLSNLQKALETAPNELQVSMNQLAACDESIGDPLNRNTNVFIVHHSYRVPSAAEVAQPVGALPKRPMIQCSIHHLTLFADGSIQWSVGTHD